MAPARRLARRRVAQRTLPARWQRAVLGAAGILVVLVAWQVAASAGALNPLVASSPQQIAVTGLRLIRDGTLGRALLSTAWLFAVSFGVSLVIGLVAGVLLGWYKRVEAVVDPWVSILYATPRIALIPLIMVWAGIGFTAQVLIVITVAVFPIVINVSTGVARIDRDHLQMARSFLATNRDVLLTVALPGAMPLVLAGVRQGVMQSLIGVVVAEYFIGSTGVGGLIFNAGQTLDTATAFVGAIIFAFAALLFSALLRALEGRLEAWR